jgi:hypothetical protein
MRLTLRFQRIANLSVARLLQDVPGVLILLILIHICLTIMMAMSTRAQSRRLEYRWLKMKNTTPTRSSGILRRVLIQAAVTRRTRKEAGGEETVQAPPQTTARRATVLIERVWTFS